MEEMHKARYGERAQSFSALSELTTIPESPHVHQPGNPTFGFLWRLHYISIVD